MKHSSASRVESASRRAQGKSGIVNWDCGMARANQKTARAVQLAAILVQTVEMKMVLINCC